MSQFDFMGDGGLGITTRDQQKAEGVGSALSPLNAKVPAAVPTQITGGIGLKARLASVFSSPLRHSGPSPSAPDVPALLSAAMPQQPYEPSARALSPLNQHPGAQPAHLAAGISPARTFMPSVLPVRLLPDGPPAFLAVPHSAPIPFPTLASALLRSLAVSERSLQDSALSRGAPSAAGASPSLASRSTIQSAIPAAAAASPSPANLQRRGSWLASFISAAGSAAAGPATAAGAPPAGPSVASIHKEIAALSHTANKPSPDVRPRSLSLSMMNDPAAQAIAAAAAAAAARHSPINAGAPAPSPASNPGLSSSHSGTSSSSSSSAAAAAGSQSGGLSGAAGSGLPASDRFSLRSPATPTPLAAAAIAAAAGAGGGVGSGAGEGGKAASSPTIHAHTLAASPALELAQLSLSGASPLVTPLLAPTRLEHSLSSGSPGMGGRSMHLGGNGGGGGNVAGELALTPIPGGSPPSPSTPSGRVAAASASASQGGASSAGGSMGTPGSARRPSISSQLLASMKALNLSGASGSVSANPDSARKGPQ